jgi:hypothetical protein
VEEVVVVEDVDVVVVAVEAASGVTVQQALKVCGVPGAAVTVPTALVEVEYAQSACTPREGGELIQDDGKLIPYVFAEVLKDTVTPDVDLQSVVEGDALA